MRKLILTALAALLLTVPSTAGAATVHAESGASGLGYDLLWSLDYDTVTNDLSITVTHTRFGGLPQLADPEKAVIVLVRPNGTERPFNVNSADVTLGADDGFPDGTVVTPVRASTDGQPGIINKGTQTYTNIASRVSANRANLIDFRTIYLPPGA